MDVEIQRTTVTPDARGYLVVELHISDAPPEDASASFVLALTVRLGPYESPAMAHVQREAVMLAQNALEALGTRLLQNLRNQNYPAEPRAAPPKF